jgi:hypothetical protein
MPPASWRRSKVHMSKAKVQRTAATVWRGDFAVFLLLALIGPAFGQKPTAEPETAEHAKNRAIVEQFFPQKLLNDDAAFVAKHGRPSTKGFGFLAADLNGTGRKEFLIAVYKWLGGAAVRVLKKDGDSAVVVDEPKLCPFSGKDPKVSLIDLDPSERPAILVQTTDDRNVPGPWIFKWDGTSLRSFGAADPIDGLPCSDLADPVFVDLDGDGILEIVNGAEPENPDVVGPTKSRVFKLVNGAYVQSGIFEYFFFGVTGPDTFEAGNPKVPYVVTVANGDGRKMPPVDAAEIRLNGELIAGPDKISRRSRYLRIPVTVKDQNTIDVRITSGTQGSGLFVGIGPAAPDAQFPNSQ